MVCNPAAIPALGMQRWWTPRINKQLDEHRQGTLCFHSQLVKSLHLLSSPSKSFNSLLSREPQSVKDPSHSSWRWVPYQSHCCSKLRSRLTLLRAWSTSCYFLYLAESVPESLPPSSELSVPVPLPPLEKVPAFLSMQLSTVHHLSPSRTNFIIFSPSGIFTGPIYFRPCFSTALKTQLPILNPQ